MNVEADINDIYAILKKHYNLNVEAAIRAEVDAEIGQCYANQEMRELYEILRARGCHMIATTDMYLPASYLRVLLDKYGYTDINPIFVSCEHGVGKRGGNLQRCVQVALGVTCNIVHIGANFEDDVLGSKMQAGVPFTTVHQGKRVSWRKYRGIEKMTCVFVLKGNELYHLLPERHGNERPED